MFTSETLSFLSDLRAHNDRAWFEANRARWEAHGKAPIGAFIRAFRPRLAEISRRFVADDKPNGSAFRIHRDTRFSKDKSPYKTHIGIQFRHEALKGPASETVHAPGFYCHVSPEGPGEMEGCFGGFGMWRPEGPALTSVRERILAMPDAWADARRGLEMVGDSYKRPPAGVPVDAAHLEDLKRKDFIAVENFTVSDAIAPDFDVRFAASCRRAEPLMRFLCEAVGLPF
jgi:uncharacterized protein (TIGR02453 family)